MSNLYQDAILDAKALRASAMANAKAALEEAFEPKIQEMIAKHLSEEEEKADMEEEYGAKDEGKDVEGDAKMEGEDADIKEEELDEILNQLEEMSSKEDEKTLKEAEEGEEEGEESEEEEEKEEEGSEEESEESEEEEAGEDVDDETKIVDITLGDLKQVIQSLMSGQEEMPAEEPEAEEAPEGEETEAGGEEAEEAEVSLDEILDELEAEGAENVGEYDAHDVHHADTQGDEAFARGDEETMEELHFASFIKAPGQEKDDVKKEAKHAKDEAKHMKEEGKKHDKKEEGKMAKELKEARATINTLRKDLQEVNLLNAKYLYMNKLFKSKSLSESQKLKVINTLDRAITVKEVKRAYEIMNESLSVKKSQLKESVGFASKPAGVAPKANIVEADQFINRWQKLAGIK